MMLFVCSTGEDWQATMFDTMRMGKNCEEGVNCGHTLYVVYFITFILAT